jgi:hypothetical protein
VERFKVGLHLSIRQSADLYTGDKPRRRCISASAAIGRRHPGLFSLVVWRAVPATAVAVMGKGAIPADVQSPDAAIRFPSSKFRKMDWLAIRDEKPRCSWLGDDSHHGRCWGRFMKYAKGLSSPQWCNIGAHGAEWVPDRPLLADGAAIAPGDDLHPGAIIVRRPAHRAASKFQFPRPGGSLHPPGPIDR